MRTLAIAVLVCMSAAASAQEEAEWKLVFEDDFEREKPGDDWLLGGNGKIEDGKLACGLKHPGVALLNRELVPDVKVEMVAEARPGRAPCDLAIAFSCPTWPRPTWGYLCAFGGGNNTFHQITGGHKLHHALLRYPPKLIEMGKKYRIAAAKDGKRLTLWVDGEKLLSTTDDDVLGGPGFNHVGLLTWNGMWVHEVKVYERTTPNPDTPKYVTAAPEMAVGLDEQGKLVAKRGANLSAAAGRAVAHYNEGRYREAEKAFEKVEDAEVRAAGMAYSVAHIHYVEVLEDHRRVGNALVELAGKDPGDERMRAIGVYGDYVRNMSLYKGAGLPNGEIAAKRIIALGERNNPFYDKAWFYLARFVVAHGQEGADRGMIKIGQDVFRELAPKYPENPSLKELTGERVPWGGEFTIEDESIPLWARSAAELYRRQVEILREWFTNRQLPDGQLGGGWGDDVEILRSWGLFAFISDGDRVVRDGIERLCDGMWRAGLEKYGFSGGMGDVEHAAEPSADTVPTMIAIRYGDPLWLERNMRSCRSIRDYYTGINEKGYRHFKSSHYGGDQVGQSFRDGGDSWYNGRTMKHVVWAAWYGNRQALDMYHSWMLGWLEGTMSTEGGKKVGEIPIQIWFPKGNICPEGTDNWRADVGQYKGGPSGMINFYSAWLLTGDEKFFDLPFMKWRRNPYHFQQKLPKVVSGLAGSAKSVRYNIVTKTREVLQTDRAGLPASGLSYTVYTGGTDNWRDCNLLTSDVNFDAPHANFAAMVAEATREGLSMWLYNVDDKPMDLGVRFWQLTPGLYRVCRGIVDAENPADPRYTWDEMTDEFQYRRRADTYRILLEPRKPVALKMELAARIHVPEEVPDLAVAPRDIKVLRDEKAVVVTVHNVGMKPATGVVVSLQYPDGALWTEFRRKIIGKLDSPDDLVPKVATVEFAVELKDRYRVVLDPDDHIDEVYEGNNSAVSSATK